MKKNKPFNKLFFLSFILFAFFAFLVFPNNSNIAQASDDIQSQQYITTENYSRYGLDKTLFDVLLKMKRVLTYNSIESMIELDFFDNFASYQPSGIPQTEERLMLESDLNNGQLYLTCGENARYDFLTDYAKIISLNGLENFSLSKYTKLDASNNEIYSFNKNSLSSMTNLQILNLSNNNIYSFDLSSTNLTGKLSQIDLSNNDIEYVDLTCMAINGSVDLFNNNLSNIESIVCYNKLSFIDLSFNNLTNLSKQTLSYLCDSPLMLVQGLNKTAFLVGDVVSIYKDTYASDIRGSISYNNEGSEEQNSQFSGNIFRTTNTNFVENIYLGAGKTVLKFEVVGLDSKYEEQLSLLTKSYYFQLSLPSPTYTATVNGKVVDNFNQEDDILLTFNYNIDSRVCNYDNILQNAKIYCGKVGEEKLGNTFLVTSNGVSNISVYVEFDGITSQVAEYQINKVSNTWLFWGVFIVLGIIIVISTIVFTVRWYRAGAYVEPLTPREMSREMQKKRNYRGRLDGYVNDYVNYEKVDLSDDNNGDGQNLTVTYDEEDYTSSKNDEDRYRYSKKYGYNYTSMVHQDDEKDYEEEQVSVEDNSGQFRYYEQTDDDEE